MTIRDYLTQIDREYATQMATEHSYRGYLQQLIQTLAPDIDIVNEPTRQACGAPDYVLTKAAIPIGYIEAKNIGDSDLHGTQHNKAQFTRYKQSLNNIIFTDYLTFHWYKNGEHTRSVCIATKSDTITPNKQAFDAFTDLIRSFIFHRGERVTNPKTLATLMARKARLLADILNNALESDTQNNTHSSLTDQLAAFRQVLIHDISKRQFADMYAQTIAYGFFTARYHDLEPSLEPSTFNRTQAYALLPASNPFLKKLFGYIAGLEVDDRIRWAVDDLANLFAVCDIAPMLSGYKHNQGMEDPIMYFYEDFLAAYDAQLKKVRGVWYTPAPVVGFITRAVDYLLKNNFNLTQGLADTSTIPIQNNDIHKVQILDPAVGTGAFLAQVIQHIHAQQQNQQGTWNTYVYQHLLPRIHGFELLMTSYAVAHIQIDMMLRKTGIKKTTDDRIGVYLTNSLEEDQPAQESFAFARWLTDEANQANRIKRDMPVMVVLGNPPYSAISANNGEWIDGLISDYKKEPESGNALQERKHWLNDDYVKFIRYGQHYIDKNGFGIVAYICPHGFLDNPTFRGMRFSLLTTFDDIYTIDLHGNAKKKETAPDGNKDDNVFDIQQGVAITLFVKTGKKNKGALAQVPLAQVPLAQVHHYDLYGSRADKYEFLATHALADVPFVTLPNKAPMYFMVPKDFVGEETYKKGFSIDDIFLQNRTGIVTMGDSFAIDQDRDSLIAKIQDLISTPYTADELKRKYSLGKNYAQWVLDNKAEIAKLNLQPTKIAYRPFDTRWTIYSNKILWRWRGDVMRHMLAGENVGLVFKLGNSETQSAPTMVTSSIADFRSWSRPGMQGGDYVAPLYLYPDSGSLDTTSRLPNLNQTIVDTISAALNLPFVPEKPTDGNHSVFAPIDVLDYIYAVLHSPNYRDKYKAFLKIDFPRVPYPKNATLFWQLVQKGSELRALHLMKSPQLDELITSYPNDGTNVVEKVSYKNENHKVYINQTQYFGKVPQAAWDFYIGGYRPAHKWLKDRTGMVLGYDDLRHYQKIIAILVHTKQCMDDIDCILGNKKA